MGWLTRHTSHRRLFEDGIRWVDAIKQGRADAEAFACWAMHSPRHLQAFRQAWTIWHDLSALSAEQRNAIEQLLRTH